MMDRLVFIYNEGLLIFILWISDIKLSLICVLNEFGVTRSLNSRLIGVA